MKKRQRAKKPNQTNPALRKRALRRMERGVPGLSEMAGKDVADLVQELQLHQVELEMQNEALREAQIELSEARDLYLDLYESAPVGYLTLNKDRVIRQANLQAASLLGAERSELIGARIERFLPREAREEMYVTLSEVLTSGRHRERELEFKRPDGSRFFGRLGISPANGGESFFRAVLSDVTQRMEAEKTRDETLAMLDLLYRSAPIGLCLFDRELRYVRINQSLAEMNGKTTEEHIGKTAREVLPHLADTAERLAEEIFRTGEPILDWELTGETDAYPGVPRTWLESWWPLRDPDQNKIVGISVAVKDITELKRAEEELQELNKNLEQRVEERTQQLEESRERHRQRVESIPHKVWSILPDGTGEYCNQRTLDYLGMTLAEMKGWHWKEAIHPEDVERVSGDFSAMLNSERESQSEVRIRRGADGAYRWHSAHAAPMLDDRGRIVRWLGTCTDVHERKETEQRLWQMSRIFHDSAVPILVQDGEGHIVHMNEEVERVFGWSREDLIGRSLKSLLPPGSYDAFDLLLDLCRKDPSKPEKEEMVMLTQQGGPVPVLVTLSVLARGRGDEAPLTAVIAKDIGRLKQTEGALRASERALREQKKKLEEKNTALREILEQVEWEKKKIREEVAAHLEEYALPILDRFAERGENPALVEALKHSLEDLTSPRGRRFSENAARLTPKEKELCRLLRGGLTSKEVAGIMNCSPQTIEKHRKNIRKKLGIVGTGTNLGSYLNGF